MVSRIFRWVLHLMIKSDRKKTYTKFARVNPWSEDLIDWKEEGAFIAGRGKDVTIYDSATVVGDVTIGERTWIGPFCSIDGTGGLSIGKNCSISAAVHIISHDTVEWALSGGRAEYRYEPICIGDNNFIGVGAVILKGVSLGERCLVAANAVVTKSFPSYSILAGVPARKVGVVRIDQQGKVELKYDRETEVSA